MEACMSLRPYRGLLRESEFTLLSKILVVLLFVFAAGLAMFNIWRGEVRHPIAFVVTLLGLLLFVMAKLSVIRGKALITFGSWAMTPDSANLYRLGYWLMIVGTLLTFL
jgi:hypothetical protein